MITVPNPFSSVVRFEPEIMARMYETHWEGRTGGDERAVTVKPIPDDPKYDALRYSRFDSAEMFVRAGVEHWSGPERGDEDPVLERAFGSVSNFRREVNAFLKECGAIATTETETTETPEERARRQQRQAPVEDINGIGKARGERLRGLGNIRTVGAFLAAAGEDPEAVAKHAGVRVSVIEEWLEDATNLVFGEEEEDFDPAQEQDEDDDPED
jgi:hypothetical protein